MFTNMCKHNLDSSLKDLSLIDNVTERSVQYVYRITAITLFSRVRFSSEYLMLTPLVK